MPSENCERLPWRPEQVQKRPQERRQEGAEGGGVTAQGRTAEQRRQQPQRVHRQPFQPRVLVRHVACPASEEATALSVCVL